MSFTIIEDGTGSGNKAEVDDHGRLSTRASQVSHLSHHATSHLNVYVKTFKTTLQGATETPILFFKNTSNVDDLVIHHILISSDSDIESCIYTGSIYTSGGDELEMINTNLGSNVKGAGETFQGGSAANMLLDISEAVEIDGSFIGANKPDRNDYSGALILTPTTTLSICAFGSATSKVKVTLVYTSHKSGTKL